MRYVIIFLVSILMSCANRSQVSGSSTNLQSYELYQPNPDDVVAEFNLITSKLIDGEYRFEVEVLQQLKTGFSSKATFTNGEKLILLSEQPAPSEAFIGVFQWEDSRSELTYRLIRFLK